MFNTGHDVGGFSGPVPRSEAPRPVGTERRLQPALHHEFCGRKAAKSTHRGCIRRYCRSSATGSGFAIGCMPYLYTLYSRAARFAEPMLRPRFYDYRRSARIRGHRRLSTSARTLLVALDRRARSARASCLPARGPGRVDRFLDRQPASSRHGDHGGRAPRCIPLFVPAGAIVPGDGHRRTCAASTTNPRARCAFPGRGRGEQRLHDL